MIFAFLNTLSLQEFAIQRQPGIAISQITAHFEQGVGKDHGCIPLHAMGAQPGLVASQFVLRGSRQVTASRISAIGASSSTNGPSTSQLIRTAQPQKVPPGTLHFGWAWNHSRRSLLAILTSRARARLAFGEFSGRCGGSKLGWATSNLAPTAGEPILVREAAGFYPSAETRKTLCEGAMRVRTASHSTQKKQKLTCTLRHFLMLAAATRWLI